MDTSGITALTRFGLGRRSDEPLPASPRAWLRAQVAAPDAAIFPSSLPSTGDGLRALHAQRTQKLEGNPLVRPILDAEIAAQLGLLLDTTQPFRERLVWFWANHFTVSLRQGGTAAVIGAYVREAIRPHVTGRFADMLLAVMRHPAMLMYLDNADSIGPDSPAGQRRHRGLNENLARECLELHTISPDAGYTQADVTSFAAILTGWGVKPDGDDAGFIFRPRAHEPGEKILLGRTFPEGEDGGVQALAFLGTHPATYQHLARQLAAHFVADAPHPRDVATLERTLAETDGDLGAVSHALVDLQAAWAPRTKFRTPWDFTIAAMRALADHSAPDNGAHDVPDAPIPAIQTAMPIPAMQADMSSPGVTNGPANAPARGGADSNAPARRLRGAMATLGQPVWTAPLPNGWSDLAADWAQPADLIARADWAWRIAAKAPFADPTQIAAEILGPGMSQRTRDAIHHAGARQDGLAILFSSPEFQRR